MKKTKNTVINENSILQDRISNIKKRQTIAELLGISKRFKHLKNDKDDNSKYISQILFSFNITEQNPHLDIMISELANYRRQANQIKEQKKGKIIGPSSHNSLFYFLEKNLLEISYISDKDKRLERIKKLYDWFKSKQKYDEDIRTITMKTYKEKGEIDEQEALLMKMKDEKKEIIDDASHRNLELINKKMLNDYERKRLRGPSWAVNSLSSSQSMPQYLGIGKDSMMQTLSMVSSNDFITNDFTTLYSSVNGTNSFTNKNFDLEIPSFIDKPEGGLLEKDYISPIFQEQNSFLPPINRETKYSYSYLRPNYNFNDVYIENKIIESKQKSLALKRAQEEIKEKVKEYGLNRARYKQSLNKKYELKNMINMYVNRNKLSSPLLRKYKIKENNNEDIDNNKNNNTNLNFSFSNSNSPQRINPNQKNSNSSISGKNEEVKTNIPPPSTHKSIIKNSSGNKEAEKEKLKKKISFSFSQKIKVFDFKDEKEKDSSTDSYKKIGKFTPKRTLSFRKKTKLLKKRSNSQSSIIAGIKLFSGENDKIKTDKIQNLDAASKNIIDINDTKSKEYNLKLPQGKIKSEMIDKNKNNVRKSPDSFIHVISNLPLIKEKIMSDSICQIKSRNEQKLNNGPNQNFYLSAFNKENIFNFNNPYSPHNFIKIKKNKFENLSQRYNLYKDNFLNMRRSMSNDKRKEYENLVDKLRTKKVNDYEDYDDEILENDNFGYNSNIGVGKSLNLKKENSLMEAIVNPSDNLAFSRYYLPRNGSMLLSREEAIKKK